MNELSNNFSLISFFDLTHFKGLGLAKGDVRDFIPP